MHQRGLSFVTVRLLGNSPCQGYVWIHLAGNLKHESYSFYIDNKVALKGIKYFTYFMCVIKSYRK